MKKRHGRLLALGLLAVVSAILLRDNVLSAINGYRLGSAIRSLQGETVIFREVVPFQWDAVYSFGPYTSKAEMEETIGVRSSLLRETVSEGMVQLIFVKGRQVACVVQGYPDSLGYQVWLTHWEGNAARLTPEESGRFSISRGEDFLTLTQVD